MNPWDSDARRVEADRLLENGDARGEYVSVSMKVHDELEETGVADPALVARCEALLHEHERAWSAKVASLPFLEGTASCFSAEHRRGYAYARGMPEVLVLSTSRTKAENLDAFAAATPFAGLVLREAGPKELAVVAEHPCVENLVSLKIAVAGDDEALAPPLRKILSRATHLRALWLTGTRAGDRTTQAIASAALSLRVLHAFTGTIEPLVELLPRFTSLRSLHVAMPLGKSAAAFAKSVGRLHSLSVRAELGPKGLATILDAVDPRRLVFLDLQRAKIKSVEPLVNAKLHALRELELSENRLGESLAMLGAKAFPALRTLGLANAGLKDAGMEVIGRDAWPGLEELRVDHNTIVGDMSGFAAGKLLPTLKRIDLSHNKFQNKGGDSLAGAKKLSLESITLGHNWLGVKALRALLTRADVCDRLHTFRNGMNNFGAEATQLVTRNLFPRLREANLPLDDELAIALANSEGLGSIVIGEVDGAVGPEGAKALVESPYVKDMRDFGFVFAVQANEQAVLRERFGNYAWFWPER